MSTVSESSAPFLEVPAPWLCRGEVLWLSGYSSPPTGSYPPRSAFHELEGSSPYANPDITGEFKGGLNSIMIVRYTETPVGPYDELIWIPGKFSVPPNNSEALRISRIYVSSKETTYNGRKNWNIPKDLAHFTFTPSTDTSGGSIPYSKVSVAPLSQPDQPFFVADITPTWLFSKPVIPFNTNYLPMNMVAVNPPLPQSPNWREDARVGTNRWWGMGSVIKGKAGFFRSQGGLEGGKYGDDVGFPDVQPMSLGFWLPDAEMEFGVGNEIQNGDDDEQRKTK